ncbi:MAG: acyl carrier protein [Pseudobutyrivibrio sp.]|nr:acyl carrier protein [Pseudobutyrivibrio sp.]
MREEIIAKIIEKGAYLWGKDVAELSENTTFEEMNAKSGHITSITVCLENEYDVMISYMDFKKCKTIGEAADYVVDLMEE